ncbi:hypothetical protein [Haloquadratum walsbyi]|uniref:Uncharacterized protein n=1 Tax=Haloquadratum walsbyi J07HQW2 TaxID=1238425 RepID=U1MYG1_9EURY|nr:hypothetical protein [Haloquadratum walsbyi]ERG95529.1 MAG: hypothetical protein J07HQW2_01987 [Haloquadratum walsbyi J07HQW2]
MESDTNKEESDATADSRCDPTMYVGSNALMADALLTLGAYNDDEEAHEYGRRVLMAVESAFIISSGAVFHADYDGVLNESHISDDTTFSSETET